MENIRRSFEEAAMLFTEFVADQDNIAKTKQCSELIAKAFQQGNKVLICGNGGSSTDAMHFAEELTGKFRKARKALPAISLTDAAHLTCVANDFGYQEVFARGVEAYGKQGDILIGLSTSGNSENIIRAFDVAESLQMKTISLLGKDGGKIKNMCDFEFIVPAHNSDRIQEIHMTILHIIIEGIERILFPENY